VPIGVLGVIHLFQHPWSGGQQRAIDNWVPCLGGYKRRSYTQRERYAHMLLLIRFDRVDLARRQNGDCSKDYCQQESPGIIALMVHGFFPPTHFVMNFERLKPKGSLRAK
jgi:hypothetical protein